MRTALVLAVVIGGLGAGVAPMAQAPAAGPPADLVLRNGRIVTMDDARPEATAVAARGGSIVAVGAEADVAPLIGPATQVIDLAGRLAIPGFIEGHGHFTGVGAARMNLNLMSTKSWDEIVAMVAAAAKKAKPGEWIVGRGWHQEKWTSVPEPNVEGFPLHASLSRVSPDNPVLLAHASGHASFANRTAMDAAGVTRDTANPPGGEILKDAKGEPTGLFRETADNLVEAALNQWRARRSAEEQEAEARKVLQLATDEVVSKGITSFQDAGSSFETIDLMKKVADEGRLGVRLWVMIRERNDRLAEKIARYRMIDYADRFLTVRAVKLTIDGALGSRGAWLLQPYSDAPGSSGLNTVPVDDARRAAAIAADHDFQFCVHAIGDRANREALDVFEEAFSKHPERKDWRWRVEHAQHINRADIPRFGKLGVIASMQGIHATSDAPYVIARLGERRAEEGAYAWQSLMKSGALVTNGTDAPVEDVDPIPNFYATVTRRTAAGKPFFPAQRMSRMEALRSYTMNNAYAAFEEKSKGSLVPGKLADIVVLSKDILRVPEEEIRSARVDYTIIGGKVRHKAPGAR